MTTQSKTYYSIIPFCTLQVMRGPGYCEAVQIRGGKITTDDPATQEHLNAICNKPGSGITDKGPDAIHAEVEAFADARAAAETAQKKMIAAGLSTA